RVAQEALHNVVKHANAHTARIELKRTGRKVRLTVEDDGIGFDPTEIARGHLGLIGMQQRAERIGAELEVGHRPGSGTRVRMTLPLAALPADLEPPVLAGEAAASAE
ncbi:MAG TPA: ATP-binding protein, partial [Candidatus Limnocylindria bacterium]